MASLPGNDHIRRLELLENTMRILLFLGSAALINIFLAESSLGEPHWKKHLLQPASETIGNVNTVVAHDWNHDGHLDIISSFNGAVILLPGPKWKKQITLYKFIDSRSGQPAKRSCIHSTLMDVDGDGDLDYCGSNQTVFWLECPRKPLLESWTYRTIDNQIKGTHCLIIGDVDGNGKMDLIANSGRGESQTPFPNSLTWQQVPANPHQAKQWQRHVLADRDAPGGSHYTGFGDINADGRPDICCAAKGGERFPGGEWFAWWEQPKNHGKPWTRHLLAKGQAGATNIQPVDLNNDGMLDFAATRGHGKGVLWFRAPDFQLIEIDPDIEGPHCLSLADMDQDNDIDIVTCGHTTTGVAAWYENDGTGKFRKHVVGTNQGSYDVRTVDLDADGDLDILIAGHFSNNLVWFENPLNPTPDIKTTLVQADHLELSHSFTAGTIPDHFDQQHFTHWQVKKGVLIGIPAPEEKWRGGHGKVPALQVNHSFRNAIIQTRFLLNEAQNFKLVLNAHHPEHGKYHLFRVIVTPHKLVLSKDPDPGTDDRTRQPLATTDLQIESGQWHTLTAELLDQQVLVHIDGKFHVRGKDDKLNVLKSSFKFGMAGPVAQLDDIRFYRAKQDPKIRKQGTIDNSK